MYTKLGTNGGTRFIMATKTPTGDVVEISSDEEFDTTAPVASPTSPVAAGGSAVAPTGLVRTRVAALEAAAVTLANMGVQPPPPPPREFREETTQIDPLVFPFVYPPKGKWSR